MYKSGINKKPIAGRFWLGFLLLSLSALTVFVLQVNAEEFENNIEIEKDADVKHDESIAINFSFPVLVAAIEESLSIVPSQQVSFQWEDGNKRVSIIPKQNWKTEENYRITISGGKDIFFRQINKEFEFETEPFPKVVSFFPVNEEKDVAIDMEDPVRIKFDSSIERYAIKLVVNPLEQLDWQISEDKTEILLLAKDDFKWDTHYTIEVFVRSKSQPTQEYIKIADTSFDTANPPVPQTWDADPKIRAEQAKIFTQPKLSTGKYIDINLSKQTMVIFQDSKVLEAYSISSGKRGMETPTGSFTIQNKAPRVWSKAYSLFMPYWMAIIPSGKIGIHELPEWPGGYKEGANHLGQAVSHGCVRLGEGAAKYVYDWAEIGTPVIVY